MIKEFEKALKSYCESVKAFNKKNNVTNFWKYREASSKLNEILEIDLEYIEEYVKNNFDYFEREYGLNREAWLN